MKNIRKITKNKKSLLDVLQKYEKMFDETLGKYTGSNYTIELKEVNNLIMQSLFLF